MNKKQAKDVTEKLNDVYSGINIPEFILDKDQSPDMSGGDEGSRESPIILKGEISNKKQAYYTLEEFLEQVKHMRYHQPLYKQLKAILKDQGHWKDAKKGGSFKPGNPYRFTKHKQKD